MRADVRTSYLEKLDQTLSNVLQLSPQRGLLAEDFDAELERASSFTNISRGSLRPAFGQLNQSKYPRAWIRSASRDVFRHKRGLRQENRQRSVRVE